MRGGGVERTVDIYDIGKRGEGFEIAKIMLTLLMRSPLIWCGVHKLLWNQEIQDSWNFLEQNKEIPVIVQVL